jgi:hypothetical protein
MRSLRRREISQADDARPRWTTAKVLLASRSESHRGDSGCVPEWRMDRCGAGMEEVR